MAKKSIAYKEFSAATTSRKDPFYPINDDQGKIIYNQYKEIAIKEKDVMFIGRLAEYRYYNMDQVINSSIKSFDRFMQRVKLRR